MLSRLAITFLPRSKHILISWLQSPSAVILEPRKIKSATIYTVSPSISLEVMGPDAMILVSWMLSFKPTFSLFSFTFFFPSKLFYFKLIYFNWRLITLQYFIGFAIHWHESSMGVHVFPILDPLPSLSPSHPSGSSQCTSPQHPVSCIEPWLAIYFTYRNIHVSMPFSKPSHPHPLPQSPKDCFINLCLFCCVTYRVIVTIFLNSIYMH